MRTMFVGYAVVLVLGVAWFVVAALRAVAP